MHTQPSLGHAEAYLNIHLSRSGPGHHGKPAGPFATVSRESGTGGSLFAAELAHRLEAELPGDSPWTVFDRNLVETMLLSRELSPRLAQFLPEDKVSEIEASVGELFGLHPSLYELTQRTNDTMRQLARVGHVVLVGRGANFATAGIEHGVHVRLTAPPEHRANHAAQQLGVEPEAGWAHNARVDAARRKYVRAVFDAEIDDPGGYDLMLNIATIPIEQAASLVAEVLGSRVPAGV